MGRDHSELDAVLFVVDDNALVADALCRLVRTVGLEAQSFRSLHDFALRPAAQHNGCVLLDFSQLKRAMDAGMPASDWQRGLPLIVMSGHSDYKTRSAARSLGARFCFNKPVDAQALFDAIAWVTEEAH